MSTATTALAESAAPLDVLLVDAALGPLHRFLPDMSTAKWAVSLAGQPDTTARRLGELGAEAGRILTGTSTVAPDRRDRLAKSRRRGRWFRQSSAGPACGHPPAPRRPPA